MSGFCVEKFQNSSIFADDNVLLAVFVSMFRLIYLLHQYWYY